MGIADLADPIGAGSDDRLMGELTGRSAAAAGATIFQGTVIRVHPGHPEGPFWLMNRPDDGWAEYGRPFRSLWAIADEFLLRFVGWGRDAHSAYVAVTPGVAARPKDGVDTR